MLVLSFDHCLPAQMSSNLSEILHLRGSWAPLAVLLQHPLLEQAYRHLRVYNAILTVLWTYPHAMINKIIFYFNAQVE